MSAKRKAPARLVHKGRAVRPLNDSPSDRERRRHFIEVGHFVAGLLDERLLGYDPGFLLTCGSGAADLPLAWAERIADLGRRLRHAENRLELLS